MKTISLSHDFNMKCVLLSQESILFESFLYIVLHTNEWHINEEFSDLTKMGID